MLFRFADNGNASSAACRFRRARVRKFTELLEPISGEPRILDVGGTADFWSTYRDELRRPVAITVFNQTFKERPSLPWITYVSGDARDLRIFANQQFDLCFSNSVIEHVDADGQVRMAREIGRVARGYFVQTPNAYFPIEPHFLVPGWQFMPVTFRARLLQLCDWGWMKRTRDPRRAREAVESILLLTAGRLQQLFPDSRIYRERIGPFTKSLTAWRAITTANEARHSE
ncbi:MAG: class I SAM-dependent methyltransferase [Acidobacteriota bacterium]